MQVLAPRIADDAAKEQAQEAAGLQEQALTDGERSDCREEDRAKMSLVARALSTLRENHEQRLRRECRRRLR